MQKSKLEKLRLIVSQMINDEQNEHSKLLDVLKKRIGQTDVYLEVEKVLDEIHDAKDEVLRKVYQHIQDLEK
jgi:hypothetical protein